MNFRLPKGQLRWISILWAIFGLWGSVYFTIFHPNGFVAGIAIFILAMTIGIWLQIRACAWILLVLYCLSGIVILIREVIIDHEWARLGKVFLNAWFSQALWQWLDLDETKQ